MEGIQPSDSELVRRALGAMTDQERTAAFEAIAGKYRLIVLRQCARWYPDPEAAQDVGQAAFEAAFTLLARGKGPERPDKLAGWLIEIARHRGQEYIRKTKPAGVQWADLPEGRSLEETEDDEEDRSGSAARRAHATKLVERVVATLTARQQEIYQLRFVQEMTGREIAGRLGIADKAASNEATIVQGLIADGFGALILMQEGRAYCVNLARILDDAAKTHTATTPTFAAAPAGADILTAALRQQVVNHFNDCNICDNCRTCNDKRRQLAGPYAPALIPILFAGEFRDRIDEVIRRVAEYAHTSHHSSSHPDASSPTAASIAGAVPAMAGGFLATSGAGTGAGAGAADRLQSLVHAASQSNRIPRWLRRVIPHDAGPGASIAVGQSGDHRHADRRRVLQLWIPLAEDAERFPRVLALYQPDRPVHHVVDGRVRGGLRQLEVDERLGDLLTDCVAGDLPILGDRVLPSDVNRHRRLAVHYCLAERGDRQPLPERWTRCVILAAWAHGGGASRAVQAGRAPMAERGL